MRLTTDYLLMLDAQDVFDIVAWHLLRQHAQATAPNDARCMYRAPDGRRCAVGWLIPDEIYTLDIEFIGVSSLAADLKTTVHGQRFAAFLDSHMWLLRDLQGMHDARAPYEWPVALRVIAQRHRLSAQVIDHMAREQRRTEALRSVPARDERASHVMPEQLTEAADVLA